MRKSNIEIKKKSLFFCTKILNISEYKFRMMYFVLGEPTYNSDLDFIKKQMLI